MDKPIVFADIHNHMLFGVDDGAKTETDMEKLIEASYADGVRHLCFTPHFHPGYFGDHLEQIEAAFTLARQYVSVHCPDLKLYLGNELRYEPSCTEHLRQGRCKTLNGTDYLLVDFLYDEPSDHIMRAVRQILNAGYIPVLAHAERYELFRRDLREVEELRSWGVLIQIDSQSILGGLGRGAKHRSRQILKTRMADLIASDSHNLKSRPPQLRQCYEFVAEHWGHSYADALFTEIPLRILRGETAF